VLVGLLLSSEVAAQNEVLRELEAEHQECGVYFKIISQASKVSVGNGQGYEDAARLAVEYDQNSTEMIARAAALSPHEESTEAFQSRMQIMMRQQMQSINNDTVNIAVLLKQYATFCKHLAQNPKVRANELANGHNCDSEYQCR
jgi:hypothetical protein